LISGGVVSITVTVKEHDAEFKPKSRAVQLTLVTPKGKLNGDVDEAVGVQVALLIPPLS
jgi:hypothetical protein